MKQLFCILFAALLLFCGCARTAPSSQGADQTDPNSPVPEITGYADFSDVLATKLIDGTKNKNLSPISVYLALAMVAEGAEGKTKTAMLKLLGCESLEELRGICGGMLSSLSTDSEFGTLTFANSIWMKKGIHFHEDYLKVLADTYRAEANNVKFGTEEASKQIADWIIEQNRGKIELSPDAVDFEPETVAVLINTIYLKAAWFDEFQESETAPGTFYGIDGEQIVNYMNRKDIDRTIVQGDGFLRYSLSLSTNTRMTFVLPDEGTSLSSLLGTPEKLHVLLHDGEAIQANVNVKLPKFEFQDRLDLEDTLQKLGIGIAFSGNADFSGMCNRRISISKVLQESYIGVNEKGVEASAYTMVMATSGIHFSPEGTPEINFYLTRPFLFVIEGRDGTVLFIGTVTNPTPAE